MKNIFESEFQFLYLFEAVMISVIFHPLLRMWLAVKGNKYVMMCFNRKSSYFTPVIELQPSKKSDIGKTNIMCL